MTGIEEDADGEVAHDDITNDIISPTIKEEDIDIEFKNTYNNKNNEKQRA